MRVSRHFTQEGQSPYTGIDFERRTSEIKNPDGSTVFRQEDIAVPAAWSAVATDILAQKYFRKSGVPQSGPDGKPLLDREERPVLGGERDARQVFHRLAGCWTYWGQRYGYFDSPVDASAFYDELCHMLAAQVAAPNSPQWFNTGLHWGYGLTGPAQGHYYVEPDTGVLTRATSAYERPQPSACFIQSVQDDLVNDGGIMDLWTREARIFKYGSGTGSNFSSLRGANEPLSGGGKSSGLMSFLKIGDRAAGAIKSGGTTRRAAKMVVLDLDHPDVMEFIRWKVVEEQKVAALVAGSRLGKRRLQAVMTACRMAVDNGSEPRIDVDPKTNPGLRTALREARTALVPEAYIQKVIQLAAQGRSDFYFPEYDTDWDSEAYLTVSGQNSNNSVRVSNDFFDVLKNDGEWTLKRRTDGAIARRLPASEMWDEIAYAAWACADPGVQYDTTINEWHTCPADGRINASNPCSEYLFLDDTACNLASINLAKFLREDGSFDVEGFRHACRLWTMVLEISVLMAAYPSPAIAQRSWDFRTLGLGYANMGTVLMRRGTPYDSPEGTAICGAVTAIMHGEAYATSAELARDLGPFPGYEKNRPHMLQVMRNHRRAAYNAAASEYEGLTITPLGIDAAHCPAPLLEAARETWDRAVTLGEAHGYRNAQVTVLAPTGTIGLVMDCDTTGIEPDFSLVKFKKLAGGGYFKIINQSIPAALTTLGYSAAQVDDIVAYCVGRGSLKDAPYINHESLRAKGFDEAGLGRVEAALASSFDITFAFNGWTLGDGYVASRLGLNELQVGEWNGNLLRALGFSQAEIEAANDYCCGTMTVEGAPHLRAEHLAVFDCANRCGKKGTRFIAGRRPHRDDGGGTAVHLRRHQQDHQHAVRRHRRGRQARVLHELAAHAEGGGPLPRRLQALPAAQLDILGRRRGRQLGRRREGGRADDRARGHAVSSRAAPPARPALRLHAEGGGRRPQGVPAHGRVPGRIARRDLPRHAQGGRGVPVADELLRHRRLARAPVRRPARELRGLVRLHALRAQRDGQGQRSHQDGDVGHRLRLPRARHHLSRAHRSLPCARRGAPE